MKRDHSSKKHKQALAGAKARVEIEKRVYKLQCELLEGVTKEYLKKCALMLQPIHYSAVVEERSLDSLCGYPACSNVLPTKKGKGQRYHISLRHKEVYETSEMNMYCSMGCLLLSRLYMTQLLDTPIYARTGVEYNDIVMKFEELQIGTPSSISPTNIVERSVPSSPPVSLLTTPGSAISDVPITSDSALDNIPLNYDSDQQDGNDTTVISLGLEAFRTTERLNIQMSAFGNMWSTLSDWVSSSTKVLILGGCNLDSEGFTANKAQYNQRKEALEAHVVHSLPLVCADLQLPIPEIEQRVLGLVGTFNLHNPLPSFSTEHWRTACLIFVIVLVKRGLIKADMGLCDSLLTRYTITTEELFVLVDIFSQ